MIFFAKACDFFQLRPFLLLVLGVKTPSYVIATLRLTSTPSRACSESGNTLLSFHGEVSSRFKPEISPTEAGLPDTHPWV